MKLTQTDLPVRKDLLTPIISRSMLSQPFRSTNFKQFKNLEVLFIASWILYGTLFVISPAAPSIPTSWTGGSPAPASSMALIFSFELRLYFRWDRKTLLNSPEAFQIMGTKVSHLPSQGVTLRTKQSWWSEGENTLQGRQRKCFKRMGIPSLPTHALRWEFPPYQKKHHHRPIHWA